MDLATYIIRQIEGIHSLLGGLLSDVTAEEWIASPAPGQNPIGFNAWHLPSIQDWAIHTWMQGVEPVRARPEWRDRGMMTTFLPIGMGSDAAQQIARARQPADVLAYADAVLEAARSFVGSLSPAQFDEIPPNRLHLADARYAAPGYRADTDDMYEQPYWRLFAGACTGHCRGHLGEMDMGLQLLRQR